MTVICFQKRKYTIEPILSATYPLNISIFLLNLQPQTEVTIFKYFQWNVHDRLKFSFIKNDDCSVWLLNFFINFCMYWWHLIWQTYLLINHSESRSRSDMNIFLNMIVDNFSHDKIILVQNSLNVSKLIKNFFIVLNGNWFFNCDFYL